MKYQVKAFYPNYFSDRLIAYVCLRLVSEFNHCEGVDARAMGLSSDKTVSRVKRRALGTRGTDEAIYKDAIPTTILWRVASALFPASLIKRFAERVYLRSLRPGDIAYLWPGCSVRLYEKVKAARCTVVAERINTLEGNSRAILDEEFAGLGMAPTHGITDQSVNDELACMRLSDFIFSPSPAVTASLLSAGIQRYRILETSYGLREGEILSRGANSLERGPLTALFVGTICVRKGVHRLLHAFTQAKANATLLLVGTVAPELRGMLTSYMNANPRIKHVGFVSDLRPYYRQADFFVLPSLEEGSPLVTYLALGAGLPCLVSRAGGGGVVRHDDNGLIVDPYNSEALALAIRRLCDNFTLRNRLATASAATAPDYAWPRVAERRLALLLERTGSDDTNGKDQ